MVQYLIDKKFSQKDQKKFEQNFKILKDCEKNPDSTSLEIHLIKMTIGDILKSEEIN